jgi:hypothetical protein
MGPSERAPVELSNESRMRMTETKKPDILRITTSQKFEE